MLTGVKIQYFNMKYLLGAGCEGIRQQSFESSSPRQSDTHAHEDREASPEIRPSLRYHDVLHALSEATFKIGDADCIA
jgi:hypothetical protein